MKSHALPTMTKPRHRGHPPWVSRWMASLVVLLLATAAVLAGIVPAQAATHGPGYMSSDGYFLGAYDIDGVHGYCIDIGSNAPLGSTAPAQTVTALDGVTTDDLAKVNYVLGTWGQSDDPDVTAAVALFTWSLADGPTYTAKGGDSHYVLRAPSAKRPTILANLAMMRQAADSNAVTSPSPSMSVAMSDKTNGTLHVEGSPGSLTGTVTLTGATFADGSTSRTQGTGSFAIVGTPADGAPSYTVAADMSAALRGYGARVDLYVTPDSQRLVAAGSSMTLTAHAQTAPIALPFAVGIDTQVASRYVQAGQRFVDGLTVTVTDGAWVKVAGARVPVIATGVLYGPFAAPPTEAASPTPGTPSAGSVQLTLTGPGAYTSPNTLVASASGYYAWVWSVDLAAQGANAQYLSGGFHSRFAVTAETSVVPFRPVATTRANPKIAAPGDKLSDTVQVSSTDGDWLRVGGSPVPVVLYGTAYRVPGTQPPAQQSTVPADAVALGSVQVTATGPGSYTSPTIPVSTPGFVTWVWQIRAGDQAAAYRDYITAGWVDDYGRTVESTSVRGLVTTTSEAREYNVAIGGRAFDTITVSGFPADHGTFAGDGYWKADLDRLVHTVYGPFEDDSVLVDDLSLVGAPVLTTITTPARNGTYRLGYTDADRIQPTEPGFYVVISSFAGDDRVAPYTSRVSDILERFYVPPPQTPEQAPPSVLTQATATVPVGGRFTDTALVQGTIPDGATLRFVAYGPKPGDELPDCTGEPLAVSDAIPVTGPGFYQADWVVSDAPGMVYWVAVLSGPPRVMPALVLMDGDFAEVLAQGGCGDPGEVTVVTPVPLAVVTDAVEHVETSEPAWDVATVGGTVPADARLVFRVFRQGDGEPARCDEDTIVADTSDSPITVDGPGSFRSPDVVLDEPGVYFWVEYLVVGDGVVHAGVCGSQHETTTVVATPPSPTPTPTPTPPPPTTPAPTPAPSTPTVTPPETPTPSPTTTPPASTPSPTPPVAPPELALTGAGSAVAWGIGGGWLVFIGAVLVFGRRLALARERAGSVREEDALTDDDPGPSED